MYISTVHVSSAYLQGSHEGTLPENQFFVIRRSQEWDLSDVNERINAALALIGCLNYLMSETEM
jgi:hypothetical protein